MYIRKSIIEYYIEIIEIKKDYRLTVILNKK